MLILIYNIYNLFFFILNYPALGGILWGPLISNMTKSDYLTALNLFLTCKQYLFGYVPFWQFCGIIRVSLSAFLAQNEQAFNKCNCCYLVILLVGFPVGTSGKDTAYQWRRLLWKCCCFNAKSNSRIYILFFSNRSWWVMAESGKFCKYFITSYLCFLQI